MSWFDTPTAASMVVSSRIRSKMKKSRSVHRASAHARHHFGTRIPVTAQGHTRVLPEQVPELTVRPSGHTQGSQGPSGAGSQLQLTKIDSVSLVAAMKQLKSSPAAQSSALAGRVGSTGHAMSPMDAP
jgi:hypothetical protein